MSIPLCRSKQQSLREQRMGGGVDEKEHKGGKQTKPSETRPVAESFGPRWMCRSSITAHHTSSAPCPWAAAATQHQ